MEVCYPPPGPALGRILVSDPALGRILVSGPALGRILVSGPALGRILVSGRVWYLIWCRVAGDSLCI